MEAIAKSAEREREREPPAPEGWSKFLDVVSRSGALGPFISYHTVNRGLIKLCASGVIRTIDYEGNPILPAEWKSPHFDVDGAYLNDDDLEQQWLACNSKPVPKLGKQHRVIPLLAEMFPKERYPDGVPDPAHCPRKALKADLLKRDPSLFPLDEATLKLAIEAYNLIRLSILIS
jgi:hypothetical protein